ncbi:MAG: 3-phosphoglycerate dehydrogenase, partial [Eubacteriales bacterium]
MTPYYCLNEIAPIGLERFRPNYEETKELEQAQGILVRSASMHDMELSSNLLEIARAGAGVNNIPIDTCTKKGIVVF